VARLTEVKVPDIGDFDGVPVIEILVSTGDRVSVEDPLLTLESDKATMDVPAPADGVVAEIKVAVGDTVSEGTLIMVLDAGDAAAGNDADRSAPAQPQPAALTQAETPTAPEPPAGSASASAALEVTVPDIGDFTDVPVIEVLVAVGDTVEAETPLVTLESDKATMDVPAPQAGTVTSIRVAVGDTVSQGSVVLMLDAGGADSSAPAPGAVAEPAATAAAASTRTSESDTAPPAGSVGDEDATPLSVELAERAGAPAPDPAGGVMLRPSPTAVIDTAQAPRVSHATPAVRRFARDLGVPIDRVRGTGRKGRILKEDVQNFVKQALSTPAAPAAGRATGMGIEPIPAVDFSRFGDVEERKLTRIQRISGPFLHRAWLNVPHVTHHDEADVTDLEDFRTSLKAEAERKGVRVTALAFIMKAVAKTLAEFPTVNASLSADGQSLVLKKYFHIGIAVDTPNGLVVPVFRDVNRKGIFELAEEMADISTRARDGKLKPDEMQGGCFSISSLGGIGGTAFTPIVNAPEVAILGVTRARMQPVWDGSGFVPRLMLPLDLSYDHRVIDGAQAARFMAYLCALLGDLRRLML